MSALIRFSDMFYLVVPKHLFYSPYMPPSSILVAMRGRIPIRSYTSIMHSAILYYFTQKVYRNRVQDYAQENMRVFIETTC